MSVLRQIFERRTLPAPADPYPQGAYTGNGWGAGMVWGGYPPGGSIGSLGVEQAMRLSAVFACLRLLSEAIATLPLDTFTRAGGIRRPFRPRPDYLSFQPPQMPRTAYVSQLMLSLLTDGNAFVLTPRNPSGVVVKLVPLDPARVNISVKDGKVVYKVDSIALDPTTDLMHVAGMMLPGRVRGLSPIAYARETIGLGLNAQAFGSSFFENGALPGAVIEAPDRMSPEAAERFRDTWNGSHQGVGNANRIGVLTEGAKLAKVSVSPDDAQFLQTRQFQVPDVARIFGVPPHLIADASNSTSWGTGLQEQNLAFGQFSLRPWIERLEDAHGRLLTIDGLPDVFPKFNLDALLRASLKDRYDAAAVGIVNRFLTVNEARLFEDLPPVPWGDVPPPAAQPKGTP